MTARDRKNTDEADLRSAESARVAIEDAEPARQPETGEHGGPNGLEPTRYGDWERNGRCTDF